MTENTAHPFGVVLAQHPVSGAEMRRRLYRCPVVGCGSEREYLMTDRQYAGQKYAPHDCPLHGRLYRQSAAAARA